MKYTNGNMPAMPLPNDATGRPYVFDDYDIQNKRRAHGLSKRELFAMAAMQGILSDPNYSYVGAGIIANYSVEAADALLAELDKTGGE